MMPSLRQRQLVMVVHEFNVTQIRSRLGTLPQSFTSQNVSRAETIAWSDRLGNPPRKVIPPVIILNVINLKWEILYAVGLPNLSGLSHSPGVPHLHVNRGPFLKSLGNFSCPKSIIQIEIKKKIRARVLASKLLHFVSLIDGFILFHKTEKRTIKSDVYLFIYFNIYPGASNLAELV